MKETVKKKTWKEFKDTGLLWWINMILHTFGWVIVYEINDGEIIEVYPARTKFRGFSESSTAKGFINVTNYIKNNIDDLMDDIKDD